MYEFRPSQSNQQAVKVLHSAHCQVRLDLAPTRAVNALSQQLRMSQGLSKFVKLAKQLVVRYL